MKFDLHLHSYFSDGKCSPEEVVQECKKLGIEVMSLTDHENVSGIPEATETGKRLGMEVIPGIEFATSYGGKEYHILGYYIDYQDQKLKVFLEKWRETKITQIKKIIKKLQRFGFKISFEQVMAQVWGSIDQPHISRALFQDVERNLPILKKYLKPKEVNSQRAFFGKFLLERPFGEGLAYAKRKLPGIREVVSLVRDSGGMTFWAHPFWKIKDAARIKKDALAFQKFGLDGIEVGYPFHSEEQALVLHLIAEELSLFESGGSDFHGDGHNIRRISNFQTFGLKLNLPLKERKKTA